MLAPGRLSAVFGVLCAFVEHGLKRLPADSGVENVGLIVTGFGVALIAQHAGLGVLAVVALAAARGHSVHQGLFKTALFLGAGSVQSAGVGGNLERMGGLWTPHAVESRSIPVAALSTSGLPPGNGLISEWLTDQSRVRRTLHHAAITPSRTSPWPSCGVGGTCGRRSAPASFWARTWACRHARPG